jgi:hypothetical protein
LNIDEINRQVATPALPSRTGVLTARTVAAGAREDAKKYIKAAKKEPWRL